MSHFGEGLPEVVVLERVSRVVRRLLLTGGVGAVTVPAVCAAAGVTPSVFVAQFGTPAGAVAVIGDGVRDAHRAAIGPTLRRRRSVNMTLQAAFAAFWNTVEDLLEDHLAIQVVLQHQLLDTAGGGGRSSIHDDLVGDIEQLLIRVAAEHDTTWDLPVAILARFSMATLNGLILDRAVHRNPAESRELLALSVYQLSTCATRNPGRRRPRTPA